MGQSEDLNCPEKSLEVAEILLRWDVWLILFERRQNRELLKSMFDPGAPGFLYFSSISERVSTRCFASCFNVK